MSEALNFIDRLRTQWRAFRHIRAVRGFRSRSGLYRPNVSQPNWQVIICLSFSLVILCFLFVDEAAGHWKSSVPQEIYQLFREITRLGKSEILLVPAGLAALLLGSLSWTKLGMSAKAVLVNFQLLGLYVFIAVAGSGISNNMIKMAIGRARPRHFEELGVLHFDPPGLSSGFQSFPSGHSATAGAMAIILLLLVPRLKWTWLTIALWIAGSRIVVGAHYPSDSIAGFVYGASFAWLLAWWFANRRLLFRTRDGLIRLPSSNPLSLSKLYKALHMLGQKA